MKEKKRLQLSVLILKKGVVPGTETPEDRRILLPVHELNLKQHGKKHILTCIAPSYESLKTLSTFTPDSNGALLKNENGCKSLLYFKIHSFVVDANKWTHPVRVKFTVSEIDESHIENFSINTPLFL